MTFERSILLPILVGTTHILPLLLILRYRWFRYLLIVLPIDLFVCSDAISFGYIILLLILLHSCWVFSFWEVLFCVHSVVHCWAVHPSTICSSFFICSTLFTVVWTVGAICYTPTYILHCSSCCSIGIWLLPLFCWCTLLLLRCWSGWCSSVV